jgi:hypothetical protein
MRRLFLALALAAPLALPAVQMTQHAQAYAEWCFDDPIVAVNGNLMDIRVTMPLANLLTMRNTSLTVTVPSNVSGAVILNDISAFPMQTTIAHNKTTWSGKGSIPVTIGVLVTATTTYSTSVVATPVLNLSNLFAMPVSASGTTNQAFSLSMSVGR